MKRDGTFARPPTILTAGTGELFEQTRDAAVRAVYKAAPYTVLRHLNYDAWKDIEITFDPRALNSSNNQLAKLYALQAREAAAKRARILAQNAERARLGVEQARQQYAHTTLSAEDSELVNPIINAYRNRNLSTPTVSIRCSDYYEYIAGSVIARSIDRNIGVFLINIVAINKRDELINNGSMSGELCGNPAQPLQPGATLNIQARAQFRKYDTGWRFERFMQ